MRRRIVILAAAFLLAVISGGAVLSYARSADKRALSGKAGIWVVVAKERIPDGTTGADIRSRNLSDRILVPAETVPEGALTELDTALDAMSLIAAVEPKQLLLRPFFAAADTTAKTSRIDIPAGQLAVTVSLAVAPQVAGNVEPGDRVTVYGTCPAAAASLDDQYTQMLMPSVQVITIGEASLVAPTTPSATGSAQPTAEATTAASGDRYVVTLAADQKDAPRLIMAARTCLLYLALLGPSATVTPGPQVNLKDLFK
ncbi:MULTISPECIES: RcpC/CpaB family pilus assembly protein [Actinoplanes]|uniref:Flp pilus assembly protein CpaB n=1 Tax=Actinoplanes TaxID=1865 RepID=UPI0005F2B709|nr:MULTISPECIES: RcpC/CpaB family pilus assembly protein [Actinoplanes]GLY02633.1 hypothetical protein Acsp01_30120 [Actinoplanes sp. NBRC 101535]